jgi:hypothetical protein
MDMLYFGADQNKSKGKMQTANPKPALPFDFCALPFDLLFLV